MIVPSAWDTMKRVVEEGTHRTVVHGEDEIHPYSMLIRVLGEARGTLRTPLFNRAYREVIGSGPSVSQGLGCEGTCRLTKPDEVSRGEPNNNIEAL